MYLSTMMMCGLGLGQVRPQFRNEWAQSAPLIQLNWDSSDIPLYTKNISSRISRVHMDDD